MISMVQANRDLLRKFKKRLQAADTLLEGALPYLELMTIFTETFGLSQEEVSPFLRKEDKSAKINY